MLADFGLHPASSMLSVLFEPAQIVIASFLVDGLLPKVLGL